MVSRMRKDNPEEAVYRLLERLDRAETQPFGKSTSVSEGQTRFIGLESLIVIGSQVVSGLLHVIGRLTIEGIGILTVNGLIELFGNMKVKAGGTIEVDGGESPATLADGALSFETGGRVEADVDVGGIRMRSGDAVVNAGDVASIRKGDSSVTAGPLGVTINGDEIRMQGDLFATIPAAPPGVTTVPLVYSPATGRIYRG